MEQTQRLRCQRYINIVVFHGYFLTLLVDSICGYFLMDYQWLRGMPLYDGFHSLFNIIMKGPNLPPIHVPSDIRTLNGRVVNAYLRGYGLAVNCRIAWLIFTRP
jgi:hypothetical protein